MDQGTGRLGICALEGLANPAGMVLAILFGCRARAIVWPRERDAILSGGGMSKMIADAPSDRSAVDVEADSNATRRQSEVCRRKATAAIKRNFRSNWFGN